MKISPKVDELVRKTIGKGRAVEALIKSSTSGKYAKYAMFGLDNGTICHVNLDSMTAHVVEKGNCVKAWRRRQAAALKRDEAKLAKAAAK